MKAGVGSRDEPPLRASEAAISDNVRMRSSYKGLATLSLKSKFLSSLEKGGGIGNSDHIHAAAHHD